jgi:hypothetical protein
MTFETCAHCEKRKATDWLKIQGNMLLPVCRACWPVYWHHDLSRYFGEPTDGTLVTETADA